MIIWCDMVKNIFMALIRSFIVSFILLLIFAMIMFVGDISNNVVGVMVVVTYFISTLIGGLYIGSKADKNKYMWGIILGVAYFALLIMVSILSNKGDLTLDLSVIIALIVSTIGGMVGGMVS